MNHALRFLPLAVCVCLGAIPLRAEDEEAPVAGDSRHSLSLGGGGIANGAADKSPDATPETPKTSEAVSCPAVSPTQPVDATPGWLGDLAFDSKNNQWLVVSHLGRISGRIMGNSGQPVSNVFTVSPPDQTGAWSPMAAYSPDANKYLVVWVDHSRGSNLFGRFVSAAGAPEKTFDIDDSEAGGTPSLNLGGERTSALRYDAANKKFVLVWQGGAGNNLAVLTTIDLSGKRGPLVKVGTQQNKGNWAPSVAVNPDRNEYCVAYDQRNGPKWAVSRVDASTLAPGAESVVDNVTTNVDIAYNALTKKYLLIYDAGYAVGVKARILNSCNAKDASGDILIMPNQGYSSVAANPKSATYAAIGQNWQDSGNSYSVVGTGGQIRGRNVLFGTGAKHGQYLPVIRANTLDGTYAATSSRDYAMTRFVARIGCSGAGAPPLPSGNELLAWVAPAPNASGSGKVALAGTAGASIKKVEILVNLKKVGDAALANGIWGYWLETAPYKGGINLSALATDKAGATHRYTIRFNVAAQ